MPFIFLFVGISYRLHKTLLIKAYCVSMFKGLYSATYVTIFLPCILLYRYFAGTPEHQNSFHHDTRTIYRGLLCTKNSKVCFASSVGAIMSTKRNLHIMVLSYDFVL